MGLAVVGLALLGLGSLIIIYTKMYPESMMGGAATNEVPPARSNP